MLDEKIGLTKANYDLDFLTDAEKIAVTTEKQLSKYKIIIADDEPDMINATKILLRDFTFQNRYLEFIEASTGTEAQKAIDENPDAAIILLDVVMETTDAGLKVVQYIRNIKKNKIIRIILRTGQPGDAPEEKIIAQYDINDYRLKTEMTVQRLHTSIYEALRSYRDIISLEVNRIGLEKIITLSSTLFMQGSLRDFYNCILQQLMTFQKESSLCFRQLTESSGLIFVDESTVGVVVAATGKFEPYIDSRIAEVDELKNIYSHSLQIEYDDKNEALISVENGFLIAKKNSEALHTFIFVESETSLFDLDLIRVFLSHYSLALDNYMIHQQVLSTQKEIIMTLGETIEKRSHDTAYHVKRVSLLTAMLSQALDMPTPVSDILEIASTMHDIGKIAIPDSILLKPGPLTPDEFEIMKTHSTEGYNIFANSDMEILKWAATISLHHHERYDGMGYPDHLCGEDIPMSARIVAVADVFDALNHSRCYKDAWSFEKCIEYITANSGSHFDPKVINAFMDNIPKVKDIFTKFPN